MFHKRTKLELVKAVRYINESKLSRMSGIDPVDDAYQEIVGTGNVEGSESVTTGAVCVEGRQRRNDTSLSSRSM